MDTRLTSQHAQTDKDEETFWADKNGFPIIFSSVMFLPVYSRIERGIQLRDLMISDKDNIAAMLRNSEWVCGTD